MNDRKIPSDPIPSPSSIFFLHLLNSNMADSNVSLKPVLRNRIENIYRQRADKATIQATRRYFLDKVDNKENKIPHGRPQYTSSNYLSFLQSNASRTNVVGGIKSYATLYRANNSWFIPRFLTSFFFLIFIFHKESVSFLFSYIP